MHIYRKMCQENCCTFSTNFVNKEKQIIFFLDVSCFFHSTIFKITYLWLNSVLFLKGTNLCTEDRLSSTKHQFLYTDTIIRFFMIISTQDNPRQPTQVMQQTKKYILLNCKHCTSTKLHCNKFTDASDFDVQSDVLV